MKRHRSVLSRLERVKILGEKVALDPAVSSVLGLPKVKHLKIKVKKIKAAGPAEGEAGAVSPVAGAKAQPAPKGAAAATKPGAAPKAGAGLKAGAGPKAEAPKGAASPKSEAKKAGASGKS